MDIAALRKLRGNSDFSKITEELEKVANPQSQNRSDDRFWKPERDKAGNASAVIRFLPKTEEDELPWVKVYSHGFQGPTGRWYIQDSLSTIGEEDGIGVLNRELYMSSKDEKSPARLQAQRQKRRLNYIMNVLIVNDPKHPENNGKVKLMKVGKRVFDKINDAMRPTFEGDTPINVFHPDKGANFKLRIVMKDGFPNYDQSTFEGVSQITDDDEELLAILNAQHPLKEFIDPKNFKSREELDKILHNVLYGTPATQRTAEQVVDDEEFETKAEPVREAKVEPKKPVVEDEDDFDLEKFKAMLDD